MRLVFGKTVSIHLFLSKNTTRKLKFDCFNIFCRLLSPLSDAILGEGNPASDWKKSPSNTVRKRSDRSAAEAAAELSRPVVFTFLPACLCGPVTPGAAALLRPPHKRPRQLFHHFPAKRLAVFSVAPLTHPPTPVCLSHPCLPLPPEGVISRVD